MASPESLLKKMMPPMLATLVTEPPRHEDEWLFELKYDGFRAVAAISGGRVAMWSRNALDLTTRFPLITKALERLKVDEAVIDGEIVALDDKGVPRFQLLQRGDESRNIFFVFDVLWLNGHDLRKLDLDNRRELLEKLLTRSPQRIELSQQIEGDAKSALLHAADHGWEGLIGKLRASTYENKRTKNWIKLKAQQMQELAIVGYTPLENGSSGIGALLLGVADKGELRFAGKVGTGYTSKMRGDFERMLVVDRIDKTEVRGAPRMRDAVWVKPKHVAQISFTEWTADGKLRHPVFLGLRDDKTPMEAVREVAVQRVEARKSAKKPARSKTAGDKTASAPAKKTTRSRSGVTDTTAARPVKRSTSRKAASAGEVTVNLTNPDRLLYPRDGYTKSDVAAYFEAMSAAMITTLADRPLSLEHWNQGIDKPSWFHQNVGKEAPEWMTTIETPTRTSNRTVRHAVVDRPEALRWLAQMSALTIHMWSSRGASLENPDWVVFDLDPAKGKGIEQAIETALVLRKLFEQLEIPSLPKTSGKRGIHLFVPLAPGQSHEQAADFAANLSEAIEKEIPWATTERSLSARKGRLYLDHMQNGYGKTIVAPYSLRAIDGAPVSAPLKWSEVNKRLDPMKFNIRTMPKRLDKMGDLFADVRKGGIKLSKFRK